MTHWKKISIDRKSRASICPVCQREKKLALQEQLELGAECGNENCKFRAEIIAVLQIAESKSDKSGFHDITDERWISQKVLSTLENIDKSVTSIPSENRNINVPVKPQKHPFRRWIIIYFVILIMVSLIIGCWYVAYNIYEDLTSRKGMDTLAQFINEVNPESTLNLYRKQDNNTLKNDNIKPGRVSDDPFPADPLYVLNEVIFLHRIWKGSIENDSITMSIENCEENEIGGKVAYRGKSVPFEGNLMVENSVAYILLSEPKQVQNAGYFELVYVMIQKRFEGHWVAYDYSQVDQVKLFSARSDQKETSEQRNPGQKPRYDDIGGANR